MQHLCATASERGEKSYFWTYYEHLVYALRPGGSDQNIPEQSPIFQCAYDN